MFDRLYCYIVNKEVVVLIHILVENGHNRSFLENLVHK